MRADLAHDRWLTADDPAESGRAADELACERCDGAGFVIDADEDGLCRVDCTCAYGVAFCERCEREPAELVVDGNRYCEACAADAQEEA